MTNLIRTSFLALLVAVAGAAVAQEPGGSTTVGGYGEIHMVWNNPHAIVNGADSALAGTSTFDIRRFVLFVAHNFNEKIAMRSELEIEDTKLQAGGSIGEVALEQLYLDFALSQSFGVRAGLLLVPVGIINETHEPPTFNGVERPNLDVMVIPSTWREIGAGVYGSCTGGWNYRAYVMAGMKAEGISSTEGLDEAKQEGQLASAHNLAVTGRVEYAGVTGLKAGASFFYGGTSAGNPAFGTDGDGIFAIPMSTIEADARYDVGHLALRGEFALMSFDADKINTALHDSTGTLLPGAIAKGMSGWYLEAAYNIMSLFDEKSTGSLSPFVRYENYNLNSSLASGVPENTAAEHTDVTIGLTYKPTYDVAIKADWQSLGNKAFADKSAGAAASSAFSLGVGYAF